MIGRLTFIICIKLSEVKTYNKMCYLKNKYKFRKC